MMASLQLLHIWLQTQKHQGSNSPSLEHLATNSSCPEKNLRSGKHSMILCIQKLQPNPTRDEKMWKLTHQWGILKYHSKRKLNQKRKGMPSRNLNPKIPAQEIFTLPYQKCTNFHKVVLFVIAVDLMWKTLECYNLWLKVLLWHCIYCFTLVSLTKQGSLL